ncbi:MAG: type 2 lanthipeptide synthetase LanM family protein [Cyanobacteriota bacterium]|jgi:type 2 lantibiotic biosynthesis protein LanM
MPPHASSPDPAVLSPWRLRAWLEAVAPDEPHKLAKRLAWDGLDPAALEQRWLEQEQATTSVGEPWAAEEGDGEADHWWPALQVCREVLQASSTLPLLPYDSNGKRPFVDLWWPLRLHWLLWLRQELADLPVEWIALQPVSEQLADALLDRLCVLGEQVLWRGFSAGRTAGMVLRAHLGSQGDGRGEPLREHYAAFIVSHRRDGLAQLLGEYPVLGRLLGSVVHFWQRNSVALMRRVASDRSLLLTRFRLGQNHQLVAVKQGLSDLHRGGRSVSLLTFAPPDASGEVVVVYKPKNVAVDAAFQAALAELNSFSDLSPLRTLQVFAANGYGYMEYVPHQVCRDASELERFYSHAGRLTAVLYWLGCSDCHFENLIACGDQLLLVDTETLLEPELPNHISDSSQPSETAVPSGLNKRLQASVLRSGLLPHWIQSGPGQASINISALGVGASPRARGTATGWLGLNSDGMMPGRVSAADELPSSLPVKVERSHPFLEHLERFCAGFESQCLVLLAHRHHWLAPDGALNRFRGLPRRILVRSTRIYFLLQQQMLAPEALRSCFAQTMVLERLARSFLLADTRPLHWPILAAEMEQMRRLDIPFFSHAIDGDALFLSDAPIPQAANDSRPNPALLPGFIGKSGLVAARERLEALDHQEIAFQLQLIRGASATLQLQANPSPPATSAAPRSAQASSQPASTQEGDALAAARRIAQHLLDLAIVDPDGGIDWLGMDLGSDGVHFRFGAVGPALYGGSIGVACLLHRLEALGASAKGSDRAMQGRRQPAAVIAALLQPLRELIGASNGDGRLRWWRDQPLGLNGCGGLLLALQVLNEQEMVEALLAAAPTSSLAGDHRLDLIGGGAGLIGALLRQGTSVAVDLACLAGDRLLSQQNADGAWSASTHASPLLGFSHGTAGFAAALAKLHGHTGLPRFLSGAAAALAYERDRFDATRGNWPDDRGVPTTAAATGMNNLMTTWCHGAPGIALARACLWGTALWDELCREEMEVALTTTASISSTDRDHLCCGNLGLMTVLELLCDGPWQLDPAVRDRCHAAAQEHRHQALRRCGAWETDAIRLRCLSNSDGSLQVPGLFTGLSGMGLALLQDEASRRMMALLLSAGLWPGVDAAEEAQTSHPMGHQQLL